MDRLWFWFVFGVFFTLSIMMIVFGILFIRDVYYSNGGEVAFGSLIAGVILLLAGGRGCFLLSSPKQRESF